MTEAIQSAYTSEGMDRFREFYPRIFAKPPGRSKKSTWDVSKGYGGIMPLPPIEDDDDVEEGGGDRGGLTGTLGGGGRGGEGSGGEGTQAEGSATVSSSNEVNNDEGGTSQKQDGQGEGEQQQSSSSSSSLPKRTPKPPPQRPSPFPDYIDLSSLSADERAKDKLGDEGLVYGDIDAEHFAALFQRVYDCYGAPTGGVFAVAGSGAGTAAFALPLVHGFAKVTGVEILHTLHDHAMSKMTRWEEAINPYLPTSFQQVRFAFINLDMTNTQVQWSEATVLFAHCTTFSRRTMKEIGDRCSGMREGSIAMTVSKALPTAATASIRSKQEQQLAAATADAAAGGGGGASSPGVQSPLSSAAAAMTVAEWLILSVVRVPTSWGDADVYVQEKVTATKPRR